MATFKYFLIAIRPKTLLASLSPVILGTAFSFSETHLLNTVVLSITILCAMTLQIASNLTNDYLDALTGVDSNKRLGPQRATQSGLLSPRFMKAAIIVTFSFAFVLGIYLMAIGGPFIMGIGLASLYFAYGYTGGPFPLAPNGLGELAAFIFFGPLAVLGTIFLQTKTISFEGLIVGIGPGLISACILAVNNLRDRASDLDADKKTLAVIFGERFQRRLCVSLIALTLLPVCYFLFSKGHIWSLVILLLPLFFHKTWIAILYGPIDSSLNLRLAETAKYNFLYCLFLSIDLLFYT